MAEPTDLEALKAELSPAARDRFRDLLELLAVELERSAAREKALDLINSAKQLTADEEEAERQCVLKLAQHFEREHSGRRHGLMKWLRGETRLSLPRLRKHLRTGECDRTYVRSTFPLERSSGRE